MWQSNASSAEKIPLGYFVPFKKHLSMGQCESSSLWHTSIRAKCYSSDSQQETWQTLLSRYKSSCHHDKMRIAVGGPILASCLLLLLSWLRWLPWKQWGGKQNHLEQLLGSLMHAGLIFICCCLFSLLKQWLFQSYHSLRGCTLWTALKVDSF